MRSVISEVIFFASLASIYYIPEKERLVIWLIAFFLLRYFLFYISPKEQREYQLNTFVGVVTMVSVLHFGWDKGTLAGLAYTGLTALTGNVPASDTVITFLLTVSGTRFL